jgi:dTDP-4-amino-4,6-dideoxygalactose transaminase
MLHTTIAPWPSFTQEEAEAVSRVILSNRVNYWTGQECREFEKEFAEWTGARHAVALANGTVALDVALRALEVQPGDEVIVTPRTFIASASAVVLSGARPVFADVHPVSGNITADTIRAVMTERTRGIICVHLAGQPCDMDPIMELARAGGLFVIEDCAQAHGARYKGRSVGTIGDVGAWSFCQDKIMSTGGEGGMVTTNREDLWRTMWSLKDHGKDWSAVYERSHPPGFRWLHERFGHNWRMMETQAAIGRIQLRRMGEWTARRASNAARLASALSPFAGTDGIVYPPTGRCSICADCSGASAGCVHAWYKFYFQVRPEVLGPGWSRDRIAQEMASRGIPCLQGSCSEVYLEKAFAGTGLRPPAPLPVARRLGETSLMMLVHPTLTVDDMKRSAAALAEVLSLAMADRKRSAA